MTVFLHELKMNRLSLLIWTGVISFMLGVCVVIYPEMSSQMTEMTDMFADMGAFTSAFGMDKINFGEFSGYFVIECGNVLGIGGAIFAAILGVSALSKEERDRTAEFLLTQPITRRRVISEKLLTVAVCILIMNLAVMVITMLAILAVGEVIAFGKLLLIFLAYLLMQLEIAAITFGISAFVNRGAMGIGIGVAFLSYFLNILANLTEKAKVLKYLTPFGYTDGAEIIADNALAYKYLITGVVFAAAAIYLAYFKYEKKDILI
ncbi:MAG: ABC transporter permease [Ruminococcaceae bacterium]|nr:ABC transporter permease [Oscillospiraceae bacterium]